MILGIVPLTWPSLSQRCWQHRTLAIEPAIGVCYSDIAPGPNRLELLLEIPLICIIIAFTTQSPMQMTRGRRLSFDTG